MTHVSIRFLPIITEEGKASAADTKEFNSFIAGRKYSIVEKATYGQCDITGLGGAVVEMTFEDNTKKK